MTIFEQILRETNLLTEAVDVHSITTAIEKMLRVRMVYNDGKKDREGKKERIIFPIAYGLSKSGNPVVRAFEVYGSAKRGYNRSTNDRATAKHSPNWPEQKNSEYYREMPQWKLFRCDRIVSWSNEKKSFKDEKDKLVGLNPDGDNGMSQIFSISSICGKIELQNNLPIGPNPITKDDVKGVTTTPQKPDGAYNVKDIIGGIVNPLWKNQYNTEKEKEISVDNDGNVSYNKTNQAIEAPETKPITKQEIQPENPENSNNTSDLDKIEAGDQPITKTEVNGEENDITPVYQDMMDRWDKLNK